MTKDQMRAALDRVLTWPERRQQDVLEILRIMEEQDTSGWHLTDEQVAEVRRRRADKDEPSITLEELDAYLRRRGT
jgi:hypothetical protein